MLRWALPNTARHTHYQSKQINRERHPPATWQWCWPSACIEFGNSRNIFRPLESNHRVGSPPLNLGNFIFWVWDAVKDSFKSPRAVHVIFYFPCLMRFTFFSRSQADFSCFVFASGTSASFYQLVGVCLGFEHSHICHHGINDIESRYDWS